MDSSPDRLSALQRAVLAEFFAHERGFFLTGGAALAGFHLRHRETMDLDLFTTEPDAFERGSFVLADVARGLGGTLEQHGFPLESGLADALAKDGGCTAANLAWLLDQIVVRDDARLPGSVSAGTLRAWLADVVQRLRLRALPDAPPTS